MVHIPPIQHRVAMCSLAHQPLLHKGGTGVRDYYDINFVIAFAVLGSFEAVKFDRSHIISLAKGEKIFNFLEEAKVIVWIQFSMILK